MAEEVRPQRQLRSPYVRATSPNDAGIGRGLADLSNALGGTMKAGGFFDRKNQELIDKADAALAINNAIDEKAFLEENNISGWFSGMASGILEARRGLAGAAKDFNELALDPSINSLDAADEAFGEKLGTFREDNKGNWDLIESYEREMLEKRGLLQKNAVERSIRRKEEESVASLSEAVDNNLDTFQKHLDNNGDESEFFKMVLGGIKENEALAHLFLPDGTMATSEESLINGILAWAELSPEDASEMLEIAADHGKFDSKSRLKLANAATDAREADDNREDARDKDRTDQYKNNIPGVAAELSGYSMEKLRDPETFLYVLGEVGDPGVAQRLIGNTVVGLTRGDGLSQLQEQVLVDVAANGTVGQLADHIAMYAPLMTPQEREEWSKKPPKEIKALASQVHKTADIYYRAARKPEPDDLFPAEVDAANLERAEHQLAAEAEAVKALINDPDFDLSGYFRDEVEYYNKLVAFEGKEKDEDKKPVKKPTLISTEDMLKKHGSNRRNSSGGFVKLISGEQSILYPPTHILHQMD